MAEAFRKVHRVLAALFLLTIPPAAWASFQGDPADPSPLVYLPLLPLGLLSITGTWLLIRPWLRKWRGKRTVAEP